MKRNTTIRRSFAAGLIGLSAFALAACGGKPSEGDVKTKLNEVYAANGIPKEQASKLADCMAPKLVDKVSEDGLSSMMDAKPEAIKGENVPDLSKADQDAFMEAAKSCANVLMGG